MTIFHGSILECAHHTTLNSHCLLHEYLHSPWSCLRDKVSVQVQQSATRGQMASINLVHKEAMKQLELLKLAHGRIDAL